MSNNDPHHPIEDEVQDILNEAGWGEPPAPDEGRIEVVAYRACLEAARQGATPEAPTPLSGRSQAASGGQSDSSPLRGDHQDPDPCAGSARS